MPAQGNALGFRQPYEQALKGRYKRHVSRPFRAKIPVLQYPGRCPGLLCACPFGAKERKAQLQNLRVGLVLLAQLQNTRDSNGKGELEGFYELSEGYLSSVSGLSGLFLRDLRTVRLIPVSEIADCNS